MKSIGDYQFEINNPSQNYVTGTNRMGMAAGAEEKIWLKASDGTGVTGTLGRKVSGSLGSAGLDVGKPKVPDVPEIKRGGKKPVISPPNIPRMDLNKLPQNVQDAFKKYNDAGWKGNVSGQTQGTNAGRKWGNRNAQLPTTDADGNSITCREFAEIVKDL